MREHQFTSESVSEGHPDKVCDQISDALVDLFLSRDSQARCAIETTATTDYVGIMGETRCAADIPKSAIEDTIRKVVRDIGYEQDGFHHEHLTIDNRLHEQSADIAQGVDETAGKDEGAGDQGLMFGYATKETDVLMPAPLHLAHTILKFLSKERHNGTPGLGPDAKSQVTMTYRDGKPHEITRIVISTQHAKELSHSDVEALVTPIARLALEGTPIAKDCLWFINPTGKFVIGGPDGDSGLTGRKIIVDTYGGAAPHGGGAFSGKDPTKVDRSAAYAARYLAKNIVAAGLSDKCTIQLAYAIGIAKPLSFYVKLKGHQNESLERHLEAILPKIMDLTPKGIRTHLQLNRPIYQPTAAYGHFGRQEPGDNLFPWENTDLITALHRAL